jgi:hypothetical protein
MIIFKIKNEKEIRFNLKSWEREQQLCNVVSQLKKENSNSKINLTTTYNEAISFKPIEVEKCEFVESEHVRAEVHEKTNASKKTFTDSIMENLEKKQKERVTKFLELLKLQNVPINMNDPLLLRTIESVKSSTDSKIPFYANLYANMTKM